MSLAGLITRAQTEPLAIAPEFLAAILHAFEAFGESALSQIQTPAGAHEMERVGSIAIIPIHGAILKNPDEDDLERGCCDVDALRLKAQIAAADPSIEKVLLNIHSPGGSVIGVPETAAALGRLAEAKPVYAYTETVMASAAYWFGSQARAIYMTDSARVGSIGVYSLYADASKLLEKVGVSVNAIQAGKFKLAGAPFKPMSEDERGQLQSGVDQIRDRFHAAVMAKRSPSKGSMEGQTFMGASAIEAGLADGIVDELGDVLEMIANS